VLQGKKNNKNKNKMHSMKEKDKKQTAYATENTNCVIKCYDFFLTGLQYQDKKKQTKKKTIFRK
jgi:hypothetical protein